MATKTVIFTPETEFQTSNSEVTPHGLELRPSGESFYASMGRTEDADFATGSAAATLTNAAIENGTLAFRSVAGQPSYVDYDAAGGNADSAQTGTIRFLFTPHYDKRPDKRQILFVVGAASGSLLKNGIRLYHKTDGQLNVWMGDKDYAGSGPLIKSDVVLFEPSLGSETEIELNYDLGAPRRVRVFVNGVMTDLALLPAGDRDAANIGMLRFGADWNPDNDDHLADFSIRGVRVFSTVQHDAEYTGTLPPSFPTSDPTGTNYPTEGWAAPAESLEVERLVDDSLVWRLGTASVRSLPPRSLDYTGLGAFPGLSRDIQPGADPFSLGGVRLTIGFDSAATGSGLGLTLYGVNSSGSPKREHVVEPAGETIDSDWAELHGFVLDPGLPGTLHYVGVAAGVLFVAAESTSIGVADLGGIVVQALNSITLSTTPTAPVRLVLFGKVSGGDTQEIVTFDGTSLASPFAPFDTLDALSLSPLDEDIGVLVEGSFVPSPGARIRVQSESEDDFWQRLTIFGIETSTSSAHREVLELNGTGGTTAATSLDEILGVEVDAPINGTLRIGPELSALPFFELVPGAVRSAGLVMLGNEPLADADEVAVSSNGSETASVLLVGREANGSVRLLDLPVGGVPLDLPLGWDSLHAIGTSRMDSQSELALRITNEDLPAFLEPQVRFSFEVDEHEMVWVPPAGGNTGRWDSGDGTWAKANTAEQVSPHLSALLSKRSALRVRVYVAPEATALTTTPTIESLSFDYEHFSAETAPPEWTIVYGFVRDSSGAPLAGVDVEWFHDGFFVGDHYIAPSSTTARTDQAGLWSARVVATPTDTQGPYRVVFRKPGPCEPLAVFLDIAVPLRSSVSFSELAPSYGPPPEFSGNSNKPV